MRLIPGLLQLHHGVAQTGTDVQCPLPAFPQQLPADLDLAYEVIRGDLEVRGVPVRLGRYTVVVVDRHRYGLRIAVHQPAGPATHDRCSHSALLARVAPLLLVESSPQHDVPIRGIAAHAAPLNGLEGVVSRRGHAQVYRYASPYRACGRTSQQPCHPVVRAIHFMALPGHASVVAVQAKTSHPDLRGPVRSGPETRVAAAIHCSGAAHLDGHTGRQLSHRQLTRYLRP